MVYQNSFVYHISVGVISLIAEPADEGKVVRRRNICSLTRASTCKMSGSEEIAWIFSVSNLY